MAPAAEEGAWSVDHSIIDVRILFVEDQASCRTATTMLLEHLGHSVDTVASGEEALACFDPSLHQVVITDLLMPGMSGEDVAVEIKRRSPTTPVAVYTGTAFAKLKGTDAVIAKPASVDDFRNTLSALRGSSTFSDAKLENLARGSRCPDRGNATESTRQGSMRSYRQPSRASLGRDRTD